MKKSNFEMTEDTLLSKEVLSRRKSQVLDTVKKTFILITPY